jgi:CpeS-like protein
MDILEFFKLSTGKWSSIKSNHHVDVTQQQSGRSTIEMIDLAPTDPQVAALCAQHQVDPSQVLCAAQVTWDGTLEGNKLADRGTTLLAAIGNPQSGQLLRQIGSQMAISQYSVDADESVTFVTDSEGLKAADRVWFESPNVRMRHTKSQQPDGTNTVAFCSEIRLMAAKPASE